MNTLQNYYEERRAVQRSKRRAARIKERVKVLESKLQCNCDLDNWQPEQSTGHSWVCCIHKKALSS